MAAPKPPSTPPPIPERTRYEGRRVSLPVPSSSYRAPDANRVHIQPASPEVISSLITSLSIISSPANRLFEDSGVQSLPNSPNPTQTIFDPIDRLMNNGSNVSQGGSFGIDYGAFKQSSHDYMLEELPLDEMSATSPVIRTAKPPSGFSALTAPKTHKLEQTSSLKSLLRSSRPTSRESSGDDALSIGSVSIEPGAAPQDEVRRKLSSDSWEKKHGRNSKGLMYMSSKERLRESERKRAAAGVSKTVGLERIPKADFDTRSFMSETPITEEPAAEHGESSRNGSRNTSAAPSPSIGGHSPMIGVSNGGIGSGRYIPTRDSSLRNKKRTSQNRRSSRQPAAESTDHTIKEVDEHPIPAADRNGEKKRRDHLEIHTETSKFKEPLTSPGSLAQKSTAPRKNAPQPAPTAGTKLDEEDGAPFPAVAQRKARDKAETGGSKARKSGRLTPDPFERLTRRDSKRDSGRHKRLSSGAESENEHQRNGSQTPSKKEFFENKSSRMSSDARPTSADSIDDAVDAYLCSPRLSQKIKHPQTGRVISFSEVGDSEGFAVFCCVGMGLTRYITAFYDELALTLKLRLITPDRPGVGESEPYTDGTATPLSWPDDVYAICQTLKITKFSILAHSAGAIYALATALRMPQHIRGRIHLLAPWIPPSQLNVIGGQQVLPPTNSIPTSQRILRALPTPILKAANSSFMSATSSSITSSLPKQKRGKRKSAPGGRDTPALTGRATTAPGPADKENVGPHATDEFRKPAKAGNNQSLPRQGNQQLNSEAAILAAAALTASSKERQTTYDTRLTHAIWDLATSGANPAVDLLVCLERRHTIGFRYVDITRAVVIHHGSKDTRVPVDNVRWLGKMMRRCEVRVLEGEGHGLMASAQVMGGVLMEIAGEWEDWMRVVERKGGEKGIEAGRRLRESRSVSAFR